MCKLQKLKKRTLKEYRAYKSHQTLQVRLEHYIGNYKLLMGLLKEDNTVIDKRIELKNNCEFYKKEIVKMRKVIKEMTNV